MSEELNPKMNILAELAPIRVSIPGSVERYSRDNNKDHEVSEPGKPLFLALLQLSKKGEKDKPNE